MKGKTKDQALPETPVFMQQLDEVFLHKIRIGACVLMSQHKSLSFTLLKKVLEATDGNLGAQLRKLEEVGYVSMKKEFQDRKPITRYALTKKGKSAMTVHMDGIAAILQQAGIEVPEIVETPEISVQPTEPAQIPKQPQVEFEPPERPPIPAEEETLKTKAKEKEVKEKKKKEEKAKKIITLIEDGPSLFDL
jgi:DNA-binding PadR family transcriptional regulator